MSSPVMERPSRGLNRGNVRADLRDCRILITDDDQFSRELIATYLTTKGFWNLDFASTGQEALEKVQRNLPDLLILDIVMPGLDGFEVCRRLRTQHATSDLPIIGQTALDRPEDRIRMFEAGTTDLVAKPVNRFELIARVVIHLENRLLLRGLRNYRADMKQEMAAAREMQRALLPPTAELRQLEEKYGLRVAAHFESSSEIGGDFWGVIEAGPRQLGVFCVDFSGHGITAALNTFRMHTLLESLHHLAADPSAVLSEMNARLSHLLPTGQYATMFYGVIDLAQDSFSFVTAATPRAILRQHPGAELTLLDGSGVPLGITASATYTARQVAFGADALLFLYSDALIEAARPDGTMFDEASLVEVARQHGDIADAEMFLDATLAGVLEQVTYPVSDDLTVVCLSRVKA
jgi:phosphoserine phosphatase RsbU/P